MEIVLTERLCEILAGVQTVDVDSNSENYANMLRRANAVDRIRNTKTDNTTADPNDPDARGFPGT